MKLLVLSLLGLVVAVRDDLQEDEPKLQMEPRPPSALPPLIQLNASADSKSVDPLLEAKVAAFLAMAASSSENQYSQLRSLKIEPADVSQVKSIISDTILKSVKDGHTTDQNLIDTIVAKFPCKYNGPLPHAAKLKDELETLSARTQGFVKALTAVTTGSVNYDFSVNPDGTNLKAVVSDRYQSFDAARTALSDHENAVAKKTEELKVQKEKEAIAKQQCECDLKSEYDEVTAGIREREAVRKRDHPLFNFLICILTAYEGEKDFDGAKADCNKEEYPTTSVEIDYKEGEKTAGMGNCADHSRSSGDNSQKLAQKLEKEARTYGKANFGFSKDTGKELDLAGIEAKATVIYLAAIKRFKDNNDENEMFGMPAKDIEEILGKIESKAKAHDACKGTSCTSMELLMFTRFNKNRFSSGDLRDLREFAQVLTREEDAAYYNPTFNAVKLCGHYDCRRIKHRPSWLCQLDYKGVCGTGMNFKQHQPFLAEKGFTRDSTLREMCGFKCDDNPEAIRICKSFDCSLALTHPEPTPYPGKCDRTFKGICGTGPPLDPELAAVGFTKQSLVRDICPEYCSRE